MSTEMSTVLIALIAGLPAVLGVFVSAWTMVRQTRVVSTQVAAVVEKADQIHEIVNSRYTALEIEIKLLRQMLTAAQVEVAEDKAKASEKAP